MTHTQHLKIMQPEENTIWLTIRSRLFSHISTCLNLPEDAAASRSSFQGVCRLEDIFSGAEMSDRLNCVHCILLVCFQAKSIGLFVGIALTNVSTQHLMIN